MPRSRRGSLLTCIEMQVALLVPGTGWFHSRGAGGPGQASRAASKDGAWLPAPDKPRSTVL